MRHWKRIRSISFQPLNASLSSFLFHLPPPTPHLISSLFVLSMPHIPLSSPNHITSPYLISLHPLYAFLLFFLSSSSSLLFHHLTTCCTSGLGYRHWIVSLCVSPWGLRSVSQMALLPPHNLHSCPRSYSACVGRQSR